MMELVLGLMSWIGAHSGYILPADLPNLVFTTQHNMCALYGIDHKARCDASGLKGFYDKHLTIYLGTDFDPTNKHHQSRLLHELVHYVQWKNSAEHKTCLGQLEVEAYDIQDQWRKKNGLAPILAEFNRILLEASCDA